MSVLMKDNKGNSVPREPLDSAQVIMRTMRCLQNGTKEMEDMLLISLGAVTNLSRATMFGYDNGVYLGVYLKADEELLKTAYWYIPVADGSWIKVRGVHRPRLITRFSDSIEYFKQTRLDLRIIFGESGTTFRANNGLRASKCDDMEDEHDFLIGVYIEILTQKLGGVSKESPLAVDP